MIRYRIEMPQAVRTLIRQLPPELKSKVKIGLRCYRIGRSRVLYRNVGSTVQIVALGPRVDIYERAATEFSKALRKD